MMAQRRDGVAESALISAGHLDAPSACSPNPAARNNRKIPLRIPSFRCPSRLFPLLVPLSPLSIPLFLPLVPLKERIARAPGGGEIRAFAAQIMRSTARRVAESALI